MLALPLLGNAIAQWNVSRPRLRSIAATTASIVVFGALRVSSEVRFNWLPAVAESFPLGADLDIAAIDWSTVRDELNRRKLLNSETVIAAVRWREAGKIDYSMKGNVPVICLGADPREYGIVRPASAYVGRDVIIIAPRKRWNR